MGKVPGKVRKDDEPNFPCMKRISRRAEQRLEAQAPDLVALVRQTKAHPTIEPNQTVEVSLDVFCDNPILLYEWLWLAYSHDVTVTFLPEATDSHTSGH